MGKSKTTQFDAEERDFLRQRVIVLEKTVDELREINQDLAEENGRLEREITKYKCVIEAIEARINKRRKDIQEITKRLHQATMSSRAALKYSKEMESCLDQEEHYADIVY